MPTGALKTTKVYCYTIDDHMYKLFRAGKLRLGVGRSKVSSDITWDEKTVSFAALWLGDHNIYAGVREFMGDREFSTMLEEFSSSFGRADIQETLVLIDRHFGTHSYSLKDLFRDEQRSVIQTILKVSLASVESRNKEILESNYPLIQFLTGLGLAIPRALRVAADIATSSDVRKALDVNEVDLDQLERLVEVSNFLSIELDGGAIALQAGSRVAAQLERIAEKSDDPEELEKLERLVRLVRRLPLELDFWRSQNLLFSIGRRHYVSMKERAATNDEPAARWLKAFDLLSDQLGIKIQL